MLNGGKLKGLERQGKFLVFYTFFSSQYCQIEYNYSNFKCFWQCNNCTLSLLVLEKIKLASCFSLIFLGDSEKKYFS